MKRTLVIMLKEPRAGRVKTRLGREIGMVPAAWWFRHQVVRLLRRIEDPRWTTVLAVSPDIAQHSAVWPRHLARVPQGGGDLGARMTRLLRNMPRGPVCIIGGDIPGVTPAHIARAFRTLGDHDAVFGPATDGGFWLVGMKRMQAVPKDLFNGVRWSTSNALSDSMAKLDRGKVAFVDMLSDVDHASDLNARPG